MPVEVGNGFLQPQQIVHGADDDVDSGGVARLSAQVVLEGQVVALTQELQEVEEGDGKGEVRKHLTHGCRGREGMGGGREREREEGEGTHEHTVTRSVMVENRKVNQASHNFEC